MKKINRRDALTSMAAAGAGIAAAAVTASAQGGKSAELRPMPATPTPAAAPAVKTQFTDYKPQTFVLDGYTGLNKDLLEEHYKLYSGYVTNTNKANAQLAQMIGDAKADQFDFAEVRRRLGFEYDGMRIHEYYFGALKPGGSPVDDKIKTAVTATWGSWDVFVADFIRTGMMRGIGWAILYKDPMNGSLQNFWIGDHELGHPIAFQPILTMDVWEHAYAKQFGATGRKAYIDAFLKNVDWSVVSKRL